MKYGGHIRRTVLSDKPTLQSSCQFVISSSEGRNLRFYGGIDTCTGLNSMVEDGYSGMPATECRHFRRVPFEQVILS